MIISPGRGYIFVHVPKTGGTALALALEARAKADDILIGDTPKARRRKHRLDGVKTAGRLWKHMRLADLPGLIEEDAVQKLFAFTLVRNPWDRMVSYYHWLQDQSFDHPAVALAKSKDFTRFLDDPGIQATHGAETYGSYMRLPSGAEHCQAYIRLENLDQDLEPVRQHLGFRSLTVPKANVSSRDRDWRRYYSDESAALVGRLYAEDIARFGYGFDPGTEC